MECEAVAFLQHYCRKQTIALIENLAERGSMNAIAMFRQ
jgi:hypothetical protein